MTGTPLAHWRPNGTNINLDLEYAPQLVSSVAVMLLPASRLVHAILKLKVA
jgi:hypothetical protein